MKPTIALLAALTATAATQAQEVKPAQPTEAAAAQSKNKQGKDTPFKGVFYGALKSFRGETNAILFDPQRKSFLHALKPDFSAHDFLQKVAANQKDSEDQFKIIDNIRFMLITNPEMFGEFPGGISALQNALIILLLPSAEIGDNQEGFKQFIPFRKFVPGELKSLQQLTDQFGEWSERESWQDWDRLGVRGRMYWWGNVGVIVNDAGFITHLAMRNAPNTLGITTPAPTIASAASGPVSMKKEAKAAGDKFLAENGKRKEVTTTKSGLQYEVIKVGTGHKPAITDTVSVHYHGTLIDGKVFDSSVERGMPITFGVQQVIKGWTEVLQLMPVGSKWKIFIPSQLAYGENGAGGDIGPNEALIFEVELLGIVK